MKEELKKAKKNQNETKEVKKMEEKNAKKVTGETFEDLTISEMVEIQGAGDVQQETSPICISAIAISAAVPSALGSINLVSKIKKC